MKKKYLAIIALFLLVLSILSGCQKRSQDTTQDPKDVYVGTKGLEMKFLPNLPPSKLYDTSSLTLLIELENEGTYDLSGTNCRLFLSGFDDKIIRGLEKNKICSTALEARSLLNPEGGYNTQQFTTDLIDIPDYIDSLPQKMVVTACYEYQTKAAPIVCVDPHLYEIGPIERACTVRNVGVAGGQGAPIGVTGVNVEMAGKERVAFSIRVANLGTGTVLSPGAGPYTDCPFSIDPKDYNVIDYRVDMSNGQLIRCTPEIEGGQKVRLVNGYGTIFCTFKITGDTAYTTPLRITLDYNYMDSISKNIEIIKTPE